MPQSRVTSSGNEGKTRMLYKNCHSYNINSLSCSSDGESFLSADDLRINLWNLENNIEAYNVVDLKPPNIEEVSEVITHVEFHPRRSDLFMFSSSKGYVCQCDLRVSSQFERSSVMF